jgi:hypothetical protein
MVPQNAVSPVGPAEHNDHSGGYIAVPVWPRQLSQSARRPLSNAPLQPVPRLLRVVEVLPDPADDLPAEVA